MSVKNNKMKLQSFKMWSKKCAKMYALYVSNLSDNNKNDHNIHIITDENYEFNFNRLCKCSKN